MKVTPNINMKMDCEQVLFNDVVGILTIKTFDQSKKENKGNDPPPPTDYNKTANAFKIYRVYSYKIYLKILA